MKNLVRRRHQHRRQLTRQRWHRLFQRLKRRAGTLRKLIAQFAALAVVGILLLFIGLALFSPILHIKDLSISRKDPRIDAEFVSHALAPLFGEHLFFISTQEVEELLEESIPDIKSAHITKQYPSTLQISVTLNPIIARLTIDDPDHSALATGTGIVAHTGSTLIEGGDFLNDEGMYVVYNPSIIQTGTGLLQLTVVDWGVRPEPWKPLIDPALLDVMRSAESELAMQFDMHTKSRAVYVRAREFHLQLPNHSLWFDVRSPLSEQLQRYRLFLQTAGAQAATQYVDLRIKDKIVYK